MHTSKKKKEEFILAYFKTKFNVLKYCIFKNTEYLLFYI